MNFLLDTNICIQIIKQKPPEVLQRFKAYNVGDIGISSLTVAEFEFGVQKSQFPEKNKQALEQFLLPLTIVEFDTTAATTYGTIRATLEKQGTSMGSLDTLIAAHALSLQVTLITNNVKEFSYVPNLKLDNWVS
ncbi:MAG: type II toxin-antitoxin system VapC family toxin [Xenococcaceae cyanobacterium MO_207.B15]|nr:type II toxin-antitoxin system VapC family toxin [Xenococcaceae cyanobacterium MO_207.B15]MDJ0744671.1 type II toxin-antitoxin system VapC family toxin [Xenococcaceae cyanobacterium MO_167.B27]